MGKARSFSTSDDDEVLQTQSDNENYAVAAQQNAQNLGSVHFTDNSGYGNFKQSGQDQRNASLDGALFRGNIGHLLQSAFLDSDTDTIDLLVDQSNDPVSQVSNDRIPIISGIGNTADLVTILGAQRPGQRLLLYGIQGNTITIKNTAAATPNTILTPDATDFTLTDTNVALLVYDTTTTKWRVLSGGGSGGGLTDPIILNENDLGTIGFITQTIDWSLANFHRAILNGPISISHINLPVSGKWEQLILEFTQDGTGGHDVTYTQGFANGVVPLTNLTADSKTTVVFYAYNTGVSSVILAFETRSAGNTNFIHAIKAADQPPPLTVGTHAEFDTIVNNSGIVVSTGAGQLSGIFSGFRAGRTYECECFIGMRDAAIPAVLGYCWVNVATALFIGSRGFVGTQDNPGSFQSQQPSAKAIFTPAADTDTLVVDFTTNSNLAGISLLGSMIGQPESYVVIKDIT